MSINDVLAGGQQWHIECADVRAGLAQLPCSSVHTVITSPPYWGLRAYGTNPQIWGGDPACPHEWETRSYRLEGHGPNHKTPGSIGGHDVGEHQAQSRIGEIRSGFCAHCGAWLGELGSEPDPWTFVEHLVEIFREVRRVLRPDGTLWLNIGDCYAGSGRGPSVSLNKHNPHSHEAAELNKLERPIGRPSLRAGAIGKAYTPPPSRGSRIGSQHGDDGHSSGVRPPRRNVGNHDWASDGARHSLHVEQLKPKDLCLIPERLAIALQEDGWWIRSRIAWVKAAPMPESIKDRPTSAWEHVWLLSSHKRYFYDAAAVRELATWPEDNSVEDRDRAFSRRRKTEPSERQGPVERDADDRGTGRNLRSHWWAEPEMSLAWPLGPEPFKGSHFATFPSALVEKCVLAGTSARGCCPSCGAPWRRISERTFHPQSDVHDHGALSKGSHKGMPARNGWAAVPRGHVDIETTGWLPDCECEAGDPVPCVVLDPFSGAGTTVLEALRHGRRALGIELSPEYAAMASARIVQDAPMFNGGAE